MDGWEDEREGEGGGGRAAENYQILTCSETSKKRIRLHRGAKIQLETFKFTLVLKHPKNVSDCMGEKKKNSAGNFRIHACSEMSKNISVLRAGICFSDCPMQSDTFFGRFRTIVDLEIFS